MEAQFFLQALTSPVAAEEHPDLHVQLVSGRHGLLLSGAQVHLRLRTQASATTMLMAFERRLQLAVSFSKWSMPISVSD
jgi:hypothetical protein